MYPSSIQNSSSQIATTVKHRMEKAIDSDASQPKANQLELSEILEPTVLRYFETLNTGNFQETTQLFSISGVMKPPFDPPIVGAEAILNYLQVEALGIMLKPQQSTSQRQENGCTEVNVTGKVQTTFFTVNVTWQFWLSPLQEIDCVQINLIASPQELLRLRGS